MGEGDPLAHNIDMDIETHVAQEIPPKGADTSDLLTSELPPDISAMEETNLTSRQSFLKLGCAFLGNSPGIPQEFREWAFEICEIHRNVVPFSAGTNIKCSTDGAGTIKNTFRFHGERVVA